LPIVFYLVAVATPLVHLLFGSTYTYAPLYFAIVVVGYTLGIIGSYAGILMISYGDTRKFMKYQVTAVIIEIGLLLLLTPTFKALGALAALYILSPIILDLIYIKALYNQFRVRHRFGQLLNIVVPSIIMLLLCYYVTGLLQQSGASIIINLVLMLLIYPALLGIFKGISRKNMDFMRAISKTYRIGFVADHILDYAELFVRD
jgi:O-antigen/teichoic acid export membrane protein